MHDANRSLESIRAEAAVWLAKCDRGLNADEQIAFHEWRDSDGRNIAAFRDVGGVWDLLADGDKPDRTERVRAKLRELEGRDRRRVRQTAATAVLAVAASLAIFFWFRPIASSGSSSSPTVRVIQPEVRLLPDGSRVELKPGAAIAIRYTDDVRKVILVRGQAHFSVEKNPRRPFLVEAQNVIVRAVGTAFAVQIGQADLEVLVTEGKVTVAPAPSANRGSTAHTQDLPSGTEAPTVEIGQRAVIAFAEGPGAAAVETVEQVEIAKKLAWRQPQLDFTDATLKDAISLFNNHNDVRLQVADERAAKMRVTGIFRADNVESFVRALDALGIRAERASGVVVLRSAN